MLFQYGFFVYLEYAYQNKKQGSVFNNMCKLFLSIIFHAKISF